MHLTNPLISTFLLSLPSFLTTYARVLDARDTLTTSNNATFSNFNPSVQRCATNDVTSELRDSHVYYRENPTKDLKKRVPSQIIVQTHIHIVTTDDQANYYANKFTRNDIVQAQVSILIYILSFDPLCGL